jgi:hypothetical protein
MLRTIKFKTDPRIFIQNPVKQNRIIWISDQDGTSEIDWNIMKAENLIIPEPEVIDDALYPQYKIVNWNISGDLTETINTNPFSALWKAISALFKGR